MEYKNVYEEDFYDYKPILVYLKIQKFMKGVTFALSMEKRGFLTVFPQDP